ncbi:MAG: class I SAM-dependent methyltransferase [Sulfuricellaceae bacterium]|nr:class I SAM-dependent methyltransferase [Sulfuricellaceae bacterium]
MSLERIHRLYILTCLYFSPATLFDKINALPWYRDALCSWADSLGCQAGDSILEVGCATGRLTRHLAQRGALAHGVDTSPRMLRKAQAANPGVARFELASALDLPYANERFDFVIAASLLNILAEPEAAMSEMARVCRPGGTVSVLVPQAGMSGEAIAKLADRLNLSGFSREALRTWHRRAPKMQRDTVLEYFSAAGLHEVCCASHLAGMVLTVTGSR